MNYWKPPVEDGEHSPYLNRPVEFKGTPQERSENYESHRWVNGGDCTVCIECDTKGWHRSAYWPCGDEAPRENVPLANLYKEGEL